MKWFVRRANRGAGCCLGRSAVAVDGFRGKYGHIGRFHTAGPERVWTGIADGCFKRPFGRTFSSRAGTVVADRILPGAGAGKCFVAFQELACST